MSYIINMKYAILIIMMTLQVLAFDKQDTIRTNNNEYSVMNFINSNIDDIMIHVSTDTYTNGIKTKTNILWGDTLNLMIVDSMTIEYKDSYHYVFTWRNGIKHTSFTYFNDVVEVNVSNDNRNVVTKPTTNTIKYDTYEVRVFCNRVVELYYLNDVKVYSVFTLTECDEVVEPLLNNTTPKYLNPIG